MKLERRNLSIKVDNAQIRSAVYEGREHLVVPVVALVEGVLHAGNSIAPELVLTEEIQKAFAGFNGRPVMADHPEDEGGIKISANDPKVLESESFGQVFNARIEDKKLKLEAWIDPRRASKNEKADKIVNRLQNNEMVEVSVGVFVITEAKPGTFDGKEYQGIWRNIVPDHLAMLSEGIDGACSNEMGCGAPRAAQKKEENMKPKETPTPCEKAKESTWERIKCLGSLRAAQEEAFSDVDLRDALHKALQMVEPGFLGVDAVFPNESLVVYSVMPGEEFHILRRGFNVTEEGEIELKGDPEEVKPVTRFEPAETAEKSLEVKETMNEKLKARLEALINHEKSPWAMSDLEILAQFPEERLAAFEAACETPEPTPAPVVEPVKEDQVAALEAELGISKEEIKKTVKAAQAAEVAKKDALIATLKDVQKVYTEAELKAMDVEGLEKISKLVIKEGVPSTPPVIDYSGNGTTSRSASDEAPLEAPNIFEKVRQARAAK